MDSKIRMRWTADKMTLLKVDYIEKKEEKGKLRTKWLWVHVPLQSLNLKISHMLRGSGSLTFKQLKSVDSHFTRI